MRHRVVRPQYDAASDPFVLSRPEPRKRDGKLFDEHADTAAAAEFERAEGRATLHNIVRWMRSSGVHDETDIAVAFAVAYDGVSGYSATEIAAACNVSRRTYFRRRERLFSPTFTESLRTGGTQTVQKLLDI